MRAGLRAGLRDGLRDGLRAGEEELRCKEPIYFTFEELHSLSQNISFGGKITQLGVFEGKFLLYHGQGTLGQLKVETVLGQSRP